MPFRSALSGINAASEDLKVIGNNVANASTTGFKQSRAEFADVYAATDGSGANSIGAGVRLSAVKQEFGQGNIGFTDNKLDLAINGRGFFIMEDNGARIYSRSGSFHVDRDGNVVNNVGNKLVVNNADESGNVTGAVGPLKLDNSNIHPNATTNLDIGVNLDSSQVQPTTVPFDPQIPNSFNHSTSLTVYDSLGSSHLATTYYVKSAIPNQWETHLFIDGKDAKGGTAAPYTPDTLNFNGAGALAAINGQPVPPGTINYANIMVDTGAEPLNITVNLMSNTPTTQFGSRFNVGALAQNGYTSGRLSGFDIDDSGMIKARYSNGQSKILGQVSMADFANVQGLRQLGDTQWSESFTSGSALVGTPGSGSLGVLQAGALEGSNVDLTGQLVNMIEAQRNFQANAQVISTADTITQTIINIR
ncbi:MAG: flagellar hook protein FlgE [Gammaproteobacteria bacterium]|nr:flagellar hook protein FlgE [Gammaproteobacteria bacterium]